MPCIFNAEPHLLYVAMPTVRIYFLHVISNLPEGVMAVILCREDGKGFAFSPDLRNAPSVVIRNEPVPIPSHRGKKISARSDEIYACAEPEREEVWRGAFERRKVQLSSCGFHGPAHRPYRDVGPVVLEDRRLILEGLGQEDSEQQGDDPIPEPSLPPPSLPHPAPPARIQLRERMPSQFPAELAGLAGEMREGYDRLEMLRKGHGLFQLMRDAEKEKQSEAERTAQLEQGAQCDEWREADIASDISVHDDGTVLPRQPTAPESSYSHSRNRCDITSERCPTASGKDHTPQTAEWSREGMEEGGEGTPPVADVVHPWYRRLCVLVWILRAMQMESPSHMTPLSQCWRVEWTPPTELFGKKLSDKNRTVMTHWDRIVKDQKTPILRKRWKSAMKKVSRASVFGGLSRMASVSPDHQATPSRDHMMSPAPPDSPARNSTPPAVKKKQKSGNDRVREVLRQRAVALATAREEEERMKKQRKLTPAQLQQLKTTVEEELNYSKKQSRSRIDALVRKADEARMQGDPAHSPPQASLPAISLDVGSVKRRFSEAEERRKMIVHEQLTAMERDRHQALQQRFSSLQVSGNLWQDLRVMRRGVQIESTAMARRRLLMNYEWFPELLSRLPPEVHRDRYCQRLLASLEDLSRYMAGVGPARMSKRRLIAVLGTLRPWELCSPEISTAIEFLITRVIYIVKEDYENWLQHHSLTQGKSHSRSCYRT